MASSAIVKLKALDFITPAFRKISSSAKQLQKDTQGLRGAFRKIDMAGQKITGAFNKVSQVSTAAGRSMTAGVTLPVIGMGAGIIKTALKFEASMNKVSALTQASTGDLAKMRTMAKDLGKSTQFSASQAADAMGFLGMAGFNTNEIMQATPDLLNLAAASGIELARAADIASNVMGAFGMEASETGKASDILAATTAGSNVDMEMLAETMKQAAPIARDFGADLADTAAATGLLGNIGIQGSAAGTALKRAFTNLAAPTTGASKLLTGLGISVDDGQGKMLKFQDIMANVGSKLKELPQKSRIKVLNAVFGKIGLAAASNLAKVAETGELDKFAKSVRNSEGRAKQMADTLNAGAVGAVKTFKSALEGLAISFSESGLLDKFTAIIKKMTDFFNKITNTTPAFKAFIVKFALAAAAIGPFLLIFGKVVGILAMVSKGIFFLVSLLKGPLMIAIGLIKAAWIAFNVVFAASPIGAVIAGIVLLITAGVLLWKSWSKVKDFFINMFDTLGKKFSEFFGLTENVKKQIGSVFGGVSSFFGFGDDDKKKTDGQTETGEPPKSPAAKSVQKMLQKKPPGEEELQAARGRADVNINVTTDNKQKVDVETKDLMSEVGELQLGLQTQGG